MKAQILLIEDDKFLCYSIKKYFSAQGYDLMTEYNGSKGFHKVKKFKDMLDLLILDINLPGLQGLEICHRLRTQGITLPIIILTQEKATETVVNAFDLGANDYVKKPFEIYELEARVKSQLKKQSNLKQKIVKSENILINLTQRKVFIDGKEVNLRRKEFDLILYLVKNSGNVLTRDMIISNVWNFDQEPYPNTVDAHISMLRKKLGDNEQKLIQTIHGVGYRYNNAIIPRHLGSEMPPRHESAHL